MKKLTTGFSTLMKDVEKRYGKGTLMALDSDAALSCEVFSTGCIGLDIVLGTGGWPRGRIIEIYGPESSGKTTLALLAAAQLQAAGGLCGFIDAEHAFDAGYAKALGVEPEKMLVSQPSCGEEALDIAEMMARSGEVGLVVVDSVAALTPRAEIEGEMGDMQVGLQARLMGKALRKLTAAAHQTGTTILFINQLRQKIGVTFGSGETTTGGNSLKFYASVRVDIRRIGAVKRGEDIIGNRTRVKVAKNKLAPPFRRYEFDIRYGTGVCPASELLDLGVEHGVVDKSGAWYSWGDCRLGQGRERSREGLLEDPAKLAALRAAVLEAAGFAPPGVEGVDTTDKQAA